MKYIYIISRDTKEKYVSNLISVLIYNYPALIEYWLSVEEVVSKEIPISIINFGIFGNCQLTKLRYQVGK